MTHSGSCNAILTLMSMLTFQGFVHIHSAFFVGLQRKQGVKIEEGQQFDIRGTVVEFRGNISMYMFWRAEMDIFLSHVRRRQIPPYVFQEDI